LLGFLLVASPRLSMGLSEAAGDLLLFLSSTFYALFTVFSKRVRAETLSGSLAIILIVTAITFPIAAVMGGFETSFLQCPRLYGGR